METQNKLYTQEEKKRNSKETNLICDCLPSNALIRSNIRDCLPISELPSDISMDEDPVLAKKNQDPGLYTSNEGRFVKALSANILDNFKAFFFVSILLVSDVLGSRAYRGRLTPKV